ncbi:FhaA domain-containing protein [Trueperella sp. LYQ143]|uniref:FhaA domain-containing protein n=1 Tax=unclassified Trueperella TaxID=2630174 RepID=UPI00398366F3
MGAFDKIERGVENAFENVFSRAFRSDLKPVELASGIKKSMDDRAAAVSRDRVVVPNEFEISLSESDFDKLTDWGEAEIRAELTDIATEHAREQQYAFLGPVSITFTKNAELTRGKLVVRGRSRRGAAAPATTGYASPENPIIDIDGERYILTGTVTVIGRGSNADITVDDPGVSRQHLELRITPGGVIATDLNTTNGSYVEGHRITAATLLDGNTITIGRTRILFWTTPESS